MTAIIQGKRSSLPPEMMIDKKKHSQRVSTETHKSVMARKQLMKDNAKMLQRLQDSKSCFSLDKW